MTYPLNKCKSVCRGKGICSNNNSTTNTNKCAINERKSIYSENPEKVEISSSLYNRGFELKETLGYE